MKNIKNTVAAMTLAAVLGLGAVSANAGILMTGRGANTNNVPTCNATETGVFNQLTGILIVGFASLTGILMTDRQTPCVQNPTDGAASTGILIVG